MIAIIDTCIIIDALQERIPFDKYAKEIFYAVANKTFEGCITAKSVTDIYDLSHRITHSDEKSRDILFKLFSLFSVADSYGEDCKNALVSKMSDYEDAVMVETAKRIQADYIITRNTKDYKSASIPVILPEDFLGIIKIS